MMTRPSESVMRDVEKRDSGGCAKKSDSISTALGQVSRRKKNNNAQWTSSQYILYVKVYMRI